MSTQVIGYIGENGVRDIRIPIGHLLEKWPDLRPSLLMVPVGETDDAAYPVDYELEGTELIWHVSNADTAVSGTTKAAIRMVDGDGRVGLDEPFEVFISRNLSAGGTPPDAIKPWIDKLVTALGKLSDIDISVEMLAPSADPTANVKQTNDDILIELGIPTANLAYATFEVDDDMNLQMNTPEGYGDVTFELQDGYLGVNI